MKHVTKLHTQTHAPKNLHTMQQHISKLHQLVLPKVAFKTKITKEWIMDCIFHLLMQYIII